MVKKQTDELVERLTKIQSEMECILKEYVEEYAAYGWDGTSQEIATINAQINFLTARLKYAEVMTARLKYAEAKDKTCMVWETKLK